MRSLLAWSVARNGLPVFESTDHIEGIAPVPLRVRLDPGRPGKIIAVPELLTAYSGRTSRYSGRCPAPAMILLVVSRALRQYRKWSND